MRSQSIFTAIQRQNDFGRDSARAGIIELLKMRLNKGKLPNIYYYRDSNGNEIDVLLQTGTSLAAIEIKSSAITSVIVIEHEGIKKFLADLIFGCK